MKIGDEVYIHGFIDEIRQDTIIIRNDGGYFGTVPSEVSERDENSKENRNARIIYDFLKIKIGSKIVDNPFEFEDWYNRMIWHVQEWYKLQKNYKGGEIAEPKSGKWIVDRYCSECEWDKKDVDYTSGWAENYCPNCGARMENEK